MICSRLNFQQQDSATPFWAQILDVKQNCEILCRCAEFLEYWAYFLLIFGLKDYCQKFILGPKRKFRSALPSDVSPSSAVLALLFILLNLQTLKIGCFALKTSSQIARNLNFIFILISSFA